MRNILDKKDTEKQKRVYSAAIGIFIIAVMALSSVGYAFLSAGDEDKSDGENTAEYNGVEFQKTDDGFWTFKIDNYLFTTKYLPSETGNISASITKTVQDYAGNVLYIGVNSKEDISNEGNQEIARTLGQITERMNFACLSENCTEDYPIKDCASNNIIIFKKPQTSGAIQIKEEDKCVFIYSSAGNAVVAADEFIFKLLKTK